MNGLQGLSKTLYNFVFRRSSTTAIAIIGGAFVFERIFDPAMDNYFISRNKGVRTLTYLFSYSLEVFHRYSLREERLSSLGAHFNNLKSIFSNPFSS
jgi:hypothetical protein